MALLGGTAISMVVATPGWAQQQTAGQTPPTGAASSDSATTATVADSAASTTDSAQEVVVTGSRIRQTTDTGAAAPVALIDNALISARGFTNAGQALGELTSMAPQHIATSSDGVTTGLTGQGAIGANYPNLFNLGSGRTLTLINGRRTISTSGGLGDEAVDANIMPLGLLRRIDVVQGGGAVVYGSGAIAGVVNYVLKDDFKGVNLDVQAGQTSRWDYPTGSARLTAGTDFADHRGNIAMDFEYSDTGFIRSRDRARSLAGTFSVQNSVPGAGTNGIPLATYIQNINLPQISANGTLLSSASLFGASALLKVNGSAVRFNDTGDALVPFDPGTTVPQLIIGAYGGDYDNVWGDSRGATVVPQVTRYVANIVGHYDLTDDIKLSTELTYAKIRANAPDARDIDSNYANYLAGVPGLAPLFYTKNNAYLTPTEISQISAVSPTFAAGGAIPLGKGDWRQLYPNNDPSITNTTNTYRGVVAVDGKFDWAGRNFYWSASYEHSESHLLISGLYPIDSRLRKAIDAVRNSSGQIVCSVNADADPANNDPACVPINMFGSQPLNSAQRNYILANSGIGTGGTASPSVNKQDDALVTLGGELFKLPAGPLQFSASYEHRAESEAFNPLDADREGLVLTLIPVKPAKGSFNTEELSGELDIPVLGEGFSLPLIRQFDLNASYRYVDHSLAGKAGVYGAGFKWKVFDSLRLRGSYSRNFRAPNLSQLLLPSSSTNGGIVNPCAPDQIGLGLAPATRRANCLALFQANPTFGTGSSALGITQTTPVGASAETRLANFIRATNATGVVTTSGNPDLQNEIANTFTYGFVFEPKFIHGLMISADRINLKLHDAIVQLTPTQFAASCFDTPGATGGVCNMFTYDSSGQIVTGTSTAYNAGSYKLKADTFTVNYNLPLNNIFSGADLGVLNFGVQATHNRLQSQTVAGSTTRFDNTPALPDWTGRADVRYSLGRLRLNYTLDYLSRVKISFDATTANAPDFMAYVKENIRHSVSAEYALGRITVRAGVNNLTDKAPSYPTTYYGDLVGRSFFLGANVSF